FRPGVSREAGNLCRDVTLPDVIAPERHRQNDLQKAVSGSIFFQSAINRYRGSWPASAPERSWAGFLIPCLGGYLLDLELLVSRRSWIAGKRRHISISEDLSSWHAIGLKPSERFAAIR
ncbi:hypothetical protein, partial [Phyllobacterium sophorae]|uniref:hypothetical protein n=1 Tax=Phyllobacterium sophorae TaxID=1520277 RepID=UPI001AECF3F1